MRFVGSKLLCAVLAGAPGVAAAQGLRGPYVSQFGVDAQHTGRSPYRGPHRVPRVLWRVRAAHRVYASPALSAAGRLVFAGIDGVVHALDWDGVERWAYSAPRAVFATPAALGPLTFVAHDGGALVAVDGRGRVNWMHPTPEDADASPMVGPDGTVYLASRALEALGPGGAVRWRCPLGGHVFGAPALSRDGTTVYVAVMSGDLLAVRASDGHVQGRMRVGSHVYAAPLVLDDGTVVVGASDGHVRAFGPDGRLRWNFATRDEVRGTAALGRDGTVIVGSDDGGIYGLRATDGTQVFRAATAGRVRASPRIDADGFIFVGSEDDVLYALGPAGNEVWNFTIGADLDSSPLITPGQGMAVGADDGGLYYLVESDSRVPGVTEP
jgi:outer membrane protein assembly factor BamB